MNRQRFTRLAIASLAALIPVAAALSFVSMPASSVSRAPEAPALGFKKTDPDGRAKGRNVEAEVGEFRNPDATPDFEAYLKRAYPAGDIDPDSSFNALSGWASLNSREHSQGSWQLIGPSRATYPAVLDVFLG